jgi:hypothetical protein
MVKIVTGNYALQVDDSWRLGQLQEIYLQCDTTLAPVVIDLFEIADLERFWNVKIYVTDIANNAATNNIIINSIGSDTIDALGTNSLTISTDGASVELQVVSETQWLSSAAGSGSGYTETIATITSASILGGFDQIEFLPVNNIDELYDIDHISFYCSNANYTFAGNFRISINGQTFLLNNELITDGIPTRTITGKNPHVAQVSGSKLICGFLRGDRNGNIGILAGPAPVGGTGDITLKIYWKLQTVTP